MRHLRSIVRYTLALVFYLDGAGDHAVIGCMEPPVLIPSGMEPKAAAEKKKGVTLAVVDGIIAATALEHSLTLVTRNTKHFDALGVALVNPSI